MDERIKRTHSDAVTAASGREDRAMDQRAITERRELSDDERVEMFNRGLFQSTLPNLPDIPGYHLFWATTTNPRDSIQSRLQLGYELVTLDDVPGYGYLRQKDGDFAGAISVNELIAMKIRQELYERYMLANHHYSPLSEEEKLDSVLDGLKNQARGSKGRITVEEGSAALTQRAATPTFS
tara:strand:+ start:1059 stop:1601 length:543 start_codon:yes stop_codon:yes gene_type:complete